ncbi:hypothetical protein [Micromonospora sp. NPDC047074]|uniref:hypothetical protein n=1 Tax=Micromonospora sp. NPDC047074 TaxID=3154339 RepID=UPI0033C72DF6
MRHWIRGTLAALALIAATALAPSPAAHAAIGPLKATLTCDPTTETIRATATGGGYGPNRALRAVFRLVDGSYATEAAAAPIAGLGTQSTVSFTTDATGRYEVTGDEKSWPAEGYLFYSERVRVTIVDPTTGYELVWKNISCTHDVRTTYTAECDPVTHTAVIRADGQHYPAQRTLRVRYFPVRLLSQPVANDPGWETFWPEDEPPRRSVQVPVSAEGTWSEPGHTFTDRAGYYAEWDWRIEVWATASNGQQLLVGRGFVTCVTADQRP